MIRSKPLLILASLGVALAPLGANADCLKASSGEAGFDGPGTFTTPEGFEITIAPADYTPHGDNALGFVKAGIAASECLGAHEAYGLKSAALRLSFSATAPVRVVSISYCAAYPVINISAGSEIPPAYRENWKRNPIPGEITDNAGNRVAVVNAPVWNGDIYLDEAQLTLSGAADLQTVLFGLREGFITEICVN